MIFNIDREKYIESGLVTEKEHPEFPLLIYNYTPACQFGKHWDDITMMCRGLIVNKNTREIIAHPFPKFFNYEEHVANGDKTPDEIPDVYPKMDGSLGILYWWDSKPYIATRGSFVSDQAKWANEFINRWDNKMMFDLVRQDKTYLFEIIYPDNRIVVDYGDTERLVHLATIDTETGKSEDIEGSILGAVKKFPFTSVEELKKRDLSNQEGYILHYPNADFRMKIKFDNYVKLHKIITGLSEKGIWEMMSQGIDPHTQDIPDEMGDWLNSVTTKLTNQFEEIEHEVDFFEHNASTLESRKEQAEYIKKSNYPGIVFAKLDGKDYKQIIWKNIKPKGQTTFRVDIDK